MDDTGIITVRDLRRRYGGSGGRGFEAVRGVTFSVCRGELFALLGTNGAGKTSTMEVLEGLAPPTRGTVRVLGCDPCRDRARVRRRMGIVLQEGGFPSDLTVAEAGRMWAGTLSAPRPVPEALELAGLGHRAGVAVRSLSGGERRRLDLAMAILGRPEVLFLDEPTTGLDPESRRRTWQLIRGLLGSGTTIMLTTHYLEEAEALADRVAIMHQGRIVRAGHPRRGGGVAAGAHFLRAPRGRPRAGSRYGGDAGQHHRANRAAADRGPPADADRAAGVGELPGSGAGRP